jgi:hypothetical protein
MIQEQVSKIKRIELRIKRIKVLIFLFILMIAGAFMVYLNLCITW